jgi:hypothetical protein
MDLTGITILYVAMWIVIGIVIIGVPTIFLIEYINKMKRK